MRNIVTIDGKLYDATFTPVPVPTVAITASAASVLAGGALTLTVTAANAASVALAGSDGSTATLPGFGGAQIVTPAAATVTYTATATGPGGSASASVSVAVTQPAPPPAPAPAPTPAPVSGLVLLPSGVAPLIDTLDAMTGWTGEWDQATSSGGKDASGNVIPGAKGATSYPVSIGGRTARAFPSDYTNHGGFRYHIHFDTDVKATHFIYAGDLYVEDPTQLAQMELDMNQVTADGKTYIFGVQCNANDQQWDITKQDTACHWVPSGAAGNPKTWPAKTWLHFEIMSHRDDLGNITYDAVHFNGVTKQIGVTLPSARALGWGIGHLLVNWQIGGANASGSIRSYGSNVRVARW